MRSAAETLTGFMQAMKAWEEKYFKLYREPNGLQAHMPTALAELKVIYGKFLSPKDRKNGRLGSPNAGNPPEFDPAAEKIVTVNAVSPTKTVVETLWTHPDAADATQKNRYTFVVVDGELFIDQKEAYKSYLDKWEKYPF